MTLANFKATNHPQQTARRGAVDAVDDRRTPADFFQSVVNRFGPFTLDAAASRENSKCPIYYDLEDDGLTQPWHGYSVWCNPPFSDCGAWVRKAWDEWHRPALERPARIVMLLPANRTEQKWWQELVEPRRDRPSFGNPRRIPIASFRVEFLPGRMRFDRPDWTPGPKGDRPPFGCCLLIWEATS